MRQPVVVARVWAVDERDTYTRRRDLSYAYPTAQCSDYRGLYDCIMAFTLASIPLSASAAVFLLPRMSVIAGPKPS